MVANPTAFDPVLHPQAAIGRRDLVLRNMYQQHYISRFQYEQSLADRQLPTAQPTSSSPRSRPPLPTSPAGCVRRSSPPWDSIAASRTGWPSTAPTTAACRSARRSTCPCSRRPSRRSPPSCPAARASRPPRWWRSTTAPGRSGPWSAARSSTGQEDYEQLPVQPGHRGTPPARLGVQAVHPRRGAAVRIQPVFGDRLQAAEPDRAPQRGKEHFLVRNFGNTYSGPITLARPRRSPTTASSPRSALAVGTTRVARMAKAMGIRSPVSNNYAMILGGLREGVSPLDMAHAYETIAEGRPPGVQPPARRRERGPDRNRPDQLSGQGVQAPGDSRPSRSTSESSR